MVGHDRGGRVGHRLALDFPDARRKARGVRHRPDRDDVRPRRQGFRHPVFLVVLPDPAVAAARAHDPRRRRVLPARTHRAAEQDSRARPKRRRSRNICAATARPKASTPSARTIARPRRSISSTTRRMRRSGSNARCSRSGARAAWWAGPTTCWRPGAKRRPTSAATRSTAATRCRRSCRRRR